MQSRLVAALAAAATAACVLVYAEPAAGASALCAVDSGVVSLVFDTESGALASLRDSAPGGADLIVTPVAEPFWELQVR